MPTFTAETQNLRVRACVRASVREDEQKEFSVLCCFFEGQREASRRWGYQHGSRDPSRQTQDRARSSRQSLHAKKSNVLYLRLKAQEVIFNE